MLGGEDRDEERFRAFVLRVQPRLHSGFIAACGHERGREATAEALAYAWEHWASVETMTNPTGYLYRVGQVALVGALVLGFGAGFGSTQKPGVPTDSTSLTWREISFDGLRLSVPTSWPLHSEKASDCGRTIVPYFEPSSVVFVTAVQGTVLYCAPYGRSSESPSNGIVLDDDPSASLAGLNFSASLCNVVNNREVCAGTGTHIGPCHEIQRVKLCPLAKFAGVQDFEVNLPARSTPVAIEIGLVGNGQVARTILDSIRPSGRSKPTTTTTSATSTTTTSALGRMGPCKASQLTGNATRESGAASHMGIVVALANGASAGCTLDGFPSVWFVDSSGNRLGDVSVDGGNLPSSIVISPGRSASFTMWAADPVMVAGNSNEAAGAASCQRGTAMGIDIILPGETSMLLAPISIGVCTTSVGQPWATAIILGTQEQGP